MFNFIKKKEGIDESTGEKSYCCNETPVTDNCCTESSCECSKCDCGSEAQ
ncbi:MAG: hypothetical protein ACOZCL_11945 [Bacillota bacterium]